MRAGGSLERDVDITVDIAPQFEKPIGCYLGS
jgi:hypothetical protein